MKDARKIEIGDSYVNGNISDTRKAVTRMSKAEFIDFAEYLRGYHGIKLHELRHLVS